MKRGIFITFEGAEGSGKSTQILRAAAYLRRNGRKVLLLREPGGTQVSEKIRRILLDRRHMQMTPATELLLYLAARAQITQEKIRPALQKGWIVICDRYEDSTLAYQGYGRGFGVEPILRISREFVRGKLRPDLTFILDIDPKRGMQRGGRHDRMELQSLAFHNKVRRGFLELARKEPRRCVVIDSSRSMTEVSEKIWERLDRVV